jgi:hypothetical protein
MTNDSGWLISVFSLSIALGALWSVRRFRAAWHIESERLRAGLKETGEGLNSQVTQLRGTFSTIETGIVSSRESLSDGRLNLSMRSQALQMLRTGSSPETVASSLGMAASEAKLLARIGQILTVRPETGVRA